MRNGLMGKTARALGLAAAVLGAAGGCKEIIAEFMPPQNTPVQRPNTGLQYGVPAYGTGYPAGYQTGYAPGSMGYVPGYQGNYQDPRTQGQEVPTVRGMGMRMADEVERAFKGRLNNPAVARYVGEVGQSVVKSAGGTGIAYQFVVMNSDVVNHYSVPIDVNQANVYVTVGLLRDLRNEAQLASVLAQEVACIQRKFLLTKMQAEVKRVEEQIQKQQVIELGAAIVGAAVASKNRNNAVLAGVFAHEFTRAAMTMVMDPATPGKLKGYGVTAEQLYAVDADAMRYMSAAEYKPTQYRSYLETMLTMSQSDPLVKNNLMETHPISNDRVAKAETVLAEMKDKAAKGREDGQRYKDGVLSQLGDKREATTAAW
ncbi:MAG: M48 family metalloprotease [Phycisphaerae bacterium]|nr:M48 family metalloprotease [Tepidisphaeraceae bacterium]